MLSNVSANSVATSWTSSKWSARVSNDSGVSSVIPSIFSMLFVSSGCWAGKAAQAASASAMYAARSAVSAPVAAAVGRVLRIAGAGPERQGNERQPEDASHPNEATRHGGGPLGQPTAASNLER